MPVEDLKMAFEKVEVVEVRLLDFISLFVRLACYFITHVFVIVK